VRKACDEPLRCNVCLRLWSFLGNMSLISFTALILEANHTPPSPRVMDFNTDLLNNLNRQDEDSSGVLVMHHPVYGPAPFPSPTEPVYVGPIDITTFQQSKNINEIFTGLDDISAPIICLPLALSSTPHSSN
jgi:hypothetical protein